MKLGARVWHSGWHLVLLHWKGQRARNAALRTVSNVQYPASSNTARRHAVIPRQEVGVDSVAARPRKLQGSRANATVEADPAIVAAAMSLLAALLHAAGTYHASCVLDNSPAKNSISASLAAVASVNGAHAAFWVSHVAALCMTRAHNPNSAELRKPLGQMLGNSPRWTVNVHSTPSPMRLRSPS